MDVKYSNLKTWEMLKFVEQNPNARIRRVGQFSVGPWGTLEEVGQVLTHNMIWNARTYREPAMSSNMKWARLGEINDQPTVVVSLSDIDKFDTRPKDRTEASYLQEIKNYNDCALFSSHHDRAAGQKDRHIHFLLKFIDRITAGKAFKDEI